jgi:hypothetical protein
MFTRLPDPLHLLQASHLNFIRLSPEELGRLDGAAIAANVWEALRQGDSRVPPFWNRFSALPTSLA